MPNQKRPMIRIHNLETNEIIDREMNDIEFEQYLADTEKYEAEKAAKAEAELAKVILLEKLNITADEAKLLLA